MKKMKLTIEQKQSLEKRIALLEKNTSGELVVYIAKNSDDYRMSSWKAAMIVSFLVVVTLFIPDMIWSSYSIPGIIKLPIIFSTSLAAFGLAYFFDFIRLYLTPKDIIEERLFTKAHDVFLQQEVFATKHRIGILFYISHLEKQVTVLSDSGIYSRVEPESWDEIISTIIGGIKNNTSYEGIYEAINTCEYLLKENHFYPEKGQENELKDTVIME
jgi:putative membrane protein